MKIERTKNTTRNTAWGIGEKILTLLLPFFTRTILLRLLGAEYLGLNSLFGSILQVLNMADLGIGSAIVYSMYKPIAEDDHDAICALLRLYERLFKIIGTVILLIGLGLMPFLDKLISGEVPDGVNIHLIFSIYLLNTVLSYFLFAYKKSLLNAFQRNDVITKISMILLVFQYTMQIAILFIINNYYLYLLVLPIITLANNIITAIVTKKMFPQYIRRGVVDPVTKKNIKRQVSGLFISKLCGTTRNSLDSVFVSMFLGLTQVAMYSNYFYILNGVHTIVGVINTSMMGGVGNSLVNETKEKNFKDFKKFNFLYAWLSGWCCCCMVCLYQHFMVIWVGSNLTFPFFTMLIFCIYFLALSATDIKNVYISAAGLWWEDRKRALLEFVLNLILNYTLGKYFGVVGILMATLITIIVVNFFYGTYILFKYYFVDENILSYYLQYGLYYVVTFAVTVITFILCSLIPGEGIAYLIAKLPICLLLPNILFWLIYRRSMVFSEAKGTIQSVLNRTPLKMLSKLL